MLTVKLRLAAVFDAQHGGFATGWSPVSWGSIDELFVNLTVSMILLNCSGSLGDQLVGRRWVVALHAQATPT